MNRLMMLAVAPCVLAVITPLCAQVAPPPTQAWVALRTLAPGEMVQAADVEIRPLDQKMFGLFGIDASPTGLEAKHRVLSGMPVFDRDVGRHAVVKANAPVRILWQATGIQMELDGRALQDGAAGDQIRVLNAQSSRTLRGVVLPDGAVQVGNSDAAVPAGAAR